jgi:hypothetical protein
MKNIIAPQDRYPWDDENPIITVLKTIITF